MQGATVHLQRKEKARCEDEFAKLEPKLERISLTARSADCDDGFREIWIFDPQALSFEKATDVAYQTTDIYTVCAGRGCLHCKVNNRGVFMIRQLARLADKLFEISEQEFFAADIDCLLDVDFETHLVMVTLRSGNVLPFDLDDDDIVDTLYQALILESEKIP